jgi:hypothetical protein
VLPPSGDAIEGGEHANGGQGDASVERDKRASAAEIIVIPQISVLTV